MLRDLEMDAAVSFIKGLQVAVSLLIKICFYKASILTLATSFMDLPHMQYVKQLNDCFIPRPYFTQVPGYNSFVPNHCYPQYLQIENYWECQRPRNKA